MEINENYTANDHEFRDNDVYALAKYRWTIRCMKSMRVPIDAKVANIGCGAGTFTQFLAEAGYSVTATEPDSDAFLIAATRVPAGSEVRPIGLFDVMGETFDVVVMHDVLEHIDEEGAALDKIKSLLRPGGLFIMTVPALDWLYGQHDEQLGHYRRYSKSSVRRAMKGRLDILKLRYFGFFSIPIVWLLSKTLKKEYPQSATSGISVISRAYGLVCRIEERLPLPLGTSVMLIARKN